MSISEKLGMRTGSIGSKVASGVYADDKNTVNLDPRLKGLLPGEPVIF